MEDIIEQDVHKTFPGEKGGVQGQDPCPRCNRGVPDEAIRCPHCGTCLSSGCQ